MRTRYWGLYDYDDDTWLSNRKEDPTTSDLWLVNPTNRRRFDTLQQAKQFASEELLHSDVMPRPFYVTTKRKLPPEAQAVIDAVKRYDACGTGWKAVIDALRAYERTC